MYADEDSIRSLDGLYRRRDQHRSVFFLNGDGKLTFLRPTR